MDEDIKKLLEENLKLTKEMHAMTKKIKSFIVWQQVMGIIKILLIAVPIIIGIIYLPPLLNELYSSYQELLGLQSGVAGFEIPPELQKYLK